jgi:hypothetical protein
LIILPRQARDKHGKKDVVIAQGSSTEELAALKTAHDEALAAITKACEIGTFLHHLGIKTNLILPRQARDKHRESTQKQTTVLLQEKTELEAKRAEEAEEQEKTKCELLYYLCTWT